MARIKPINLLDSSSIRPERMAVLDAIQEVLELARVKEPVQVNDFGRWRHERWRDENDSLIPFLSMDWYLHNAWDESRKQLNAEMLMSSIAHEPWRQEELLGDHYDIMIVDDDLYTMQPDWPDDFIIAISRKEIGTIISTYRLQPDTFTLLKTVTLHQLGHVFNTPNPARLDVDRKHGLHCINKCVMRYVEKNPEGWEELTLDRFEVGPFCESCIRDLREYFEKD